MEMDIWGAGPSGQAHLRRERGAETAACEGALSWDSWARLRTRRPSMALGGGVGLVLTVASCLVHIFVPRV